MKLQLTLLFCFILFSANAQESMKGNWRLDPINGMGTLYGSKRGKPYQFVNISPSFAKFSGPKTLIGIDSRYSYHHRTLRGDDFNWQYIELAPFVRKYFGNSAFKPFIGAQYRLSFSGYETFKDTRLENFDLDMEIGLGYFSSKTISFDLAFDFECMHLGLGIFNMSQISRSTRIFIFHSQVKLCAPSLIHLLIKPKAIAYLTYP